MKILIVKTSSLGDIIQSFPVVAFLKYVQPDCIIDWVAEEHFASLVRSHPQINDVLTVDSRKWRKNFKISEICDFIKSLRKKKYDLVFDLQGNTKSGLVTAFAKAEKKWGFGFKTVAEWPNLLFTNKKVNPPKGKNIREDYLYLPQSAFNDNYLPSSDLSLRISASDLDQVDHFIGNIKGHRTLICPGSMWSNKKLSSENWIEYLNLLNAKNPTHFIILWGQEKEKKEALAINEKISKSSLCPALSLSGLQYLMRRVDQIIAVDSLPLHLAGTTNTPVYGIFGPSLSAKYMPLGQSAYQGTCPYGITFEKRCPRLRICPTGSCIKNIRTEELSPID